MEFKANNSITQILKFKHFPNVILMSQERIHQKRQVNMAVVGRVTELFCIKALPTITLLQRPRCIALRVHPVSSIFEAIQLEM